MLADRVRIGSAAETAAVDTYDVTYLSRTSSSANDNQYSFASYGIGVADADRRVFIIVHWQSGATHRAVSSATIGGVSATIHGQEGHTGGVSGLGAAIISAVVPTGTTATVVVNFASTVQGCAISGIRAVGLANSSPTQTLTDDTIGTANDVSVAIDIPTRGICIAAYTASANASGKSVTWTGVTEEYDVDDINLRQSLAWSKEMSVQSNRTVEASISSEADAGNALVVVSWEGVPAP